MSSHFPMILQTKGDWCVLQNVNPLVALNLIFGSRCSSSCQSSEGQTDRQRDFDRAKTNRDIGTWSHFCVKRHGNCILTLGFCTKVLDTFMIDYCHTIIGRVVYYMNICFQYYPEYPTWQYIKDGIVSIDNDISYMRSQIIITRNHDDKITYFWIKF